MDAVPLLRAVNPGVKLNIRVTVGTSAPGCVARIDPDRLVITIRSGNDEIWTTAQCRAAISSRSVWLDRAHKHSFLVLWDGLRSARGCTAGQPTGKPGTYLVSAKYGAATSVWRVFQIT